jgi:hypothetical protein
MKLRKAIKLAAAGAVIGAVPAISFAGNPAGVAFDSMWSDVADEIVFTCNTTLFICDTANAIGGAGTDDPDFYQITLTDKISGDVYYQTIQLDNGEGSFNAESFVGQETNAFGANGISSKTYVGEVEGVLGATANFDLTATITTDDYGDTGPMGGTSRTKVLLDQVISTNDGSMAAGFDFNMGTFTDVADSVFEVSTLTNAVTDGTEYTDSFELKETKIEGAPTYDGLIRKTLSAVATIDASSGIPDEAFLQEFVRNEAEGAAVSDSGVVTAGLGPNQATFTFAGGDTIVALTIDQNVGGAAAKFTLSDAANESAAGEAGVDYHNSFDSAIAVTYDGTNPSGSYDPFVNF